MYEFILHVVRWELQRVWAELKINTLISRTSHLALSRNFRIHFSFFILSFCIQFGLFIIPSHFGLIYLRTHSTRSVLKFSHGTCSRVPNTTIRNNSNQLLFRSSLAELGLVIIFHQTHLYTILLNWNWYLNYSNGFWFLTHRDRVEAKMKSTM